MRLSKKSEYACLALIMLSQNYNVKLTKAADIASEKAIPLKFLEQILAVLKSSSYIVSERGSFGGYCLSKPPSEISLAEIVRLFDGPIAPTHSVSTYYYKHTPIEQSQKLMNVFKEIRDFAASKMETVYFSDLL